MIQAGLPVLGGEESEGFVAWAIANRRGYYGEAKLELKAYTDHDEYQVNRFTLNG